MNTKIANGLVELAAVAQVAANRHCVANLGMRAGEPPTTCLRVNPENFAIERFH
jgi:hypothetical protein